MGLNVLICDDLHQHLNNFKSALINTSQSITPQKKINIAEEYFNIFDFQIIGKAINAIGKKLIPNIDIALIDSDFRDLNYQYVLDEGYDPDVERKQDRGFDLIRVLKEYNNRCVITIYSGLLYNESTIYNKARSLGVRHQQKGQPNTILPQQVSEDIEQAIYSMVRGMPKHELRILKSLYNTKTSLEEKLNCKIKIHQRNFMLKEILAYRQEIHNISYEDGVEKILMESLDKIIREASIRSSNLNGIWAKPFMDEIISQFRMNKQYSNFLGKVDERAIDLVHAFVTQNKELQEYEMKLKHHDTNLKYNLESYEKKPINFNEDLELQNKFLNCLIIRRVTIALFHFHVSPSNKYSCESYLSIMHESIFPTRKKTDSKFVTRENLRFKLSTILGLKLLSDGSFNAEYGIDCSQDSLLSPEEDEWLSKVVPKLLGSF